MITSTSSKNIYTSPSPQTVYRRVLASGLSVELVNTAGHPFVLMIAHPSVGGLVLDMSPDDLKDLADCLVEAAGR